MENGKTIVRAVINNNEITLRKDKSTYIFLWGPKEDKQLSKKELTGYTIDEVMDFFSRAIDAAKHMTFSKMTLEELLERKTEENA